VVEKTEGEEGKKRKKKKKKKKGPRSRLPATRLPIAEG